MVEPAGKVCPLCGGTGTPLREHQGVLLRECACAGRILLAWPWNSAEEYEEQYRDPDGAYHNRHMEETGRLPFWKRDTEYLGTAYSRLGKLRHRVPDMKSVLDIGAGTGAFVAMCQALGYDAAGLEPSPLMVGMAQRLGRKADLGAWADAEGTWDVVTLHDVLEHLTTPAEALRHVRQHAAVLVVEMPEYLARGVGWKRHVKPLEHPCLYNEAAAHALFWQAGLEVFDSYRPQPQDTIGKIVYFLSRVGT